MDIVIRNLTKKYGTQRAVDDISFTVKTGEILGFLGPNGAGKTTTMKAIASYLKPDEGEITVGNYSVSANSQDVKRSIGYLPEHNPLYLEMAVIDYLRFVAELQGLAKDKINGRILHMVDVCGLEAEKHKKINELSKGYRQRVGLAQALIHDPAVLILDEPTTGLDPNQIVEIRELIKNIGREKTVILSSHILAEVEATCDRIIIINHGKIVADGTSEELRKHSQGREILRLTVEGVERDEFIKAVQEISTVDLIDPLEQDGRYEIQSRPELSSRKHIFSLCCSKNWSLTELTPIQTKLEDIFHELTMNK